MNDKARENIRKSRSLSINKLFDKINQSSENEKSLDIEVVSLDSYCKKKSIIAIDFIKIDVEGYEVEIFKGATEIFREIQPKFIQIEFNWHHLFRNASLNFFHEYLPNYDVYQLIYDGWIKRDSRDPLTNIYNFSNFVFVRRQLFFVGKLYNRRYFSIYVLIFY